jgi:excisionase family DNA binding protein
MSAALSVPDHGPDCMCAQHMAARITAAVFEQFGHLRSEPERTAMTPEEAAAFLQVNVDTVYREIREGRLPALRVGRQYRLSRAALLRAMERS